MDIRRFKTTVKRSVVERYFACMTHPLVLFSGVIATVTLIVIAVISLYVPLVNSYVEGCVTSDSGTFMSNNTYSAIYNGAGYYGNKDVVKSLKNYDVNRGKGCGTIMEDISENYIASSAQIELVRASFGKSYESLNRIEQCIDPGIWNDTSVQQVGKSELEVYQDITGLAEILTFVTPAECQLSHLGTLELDDQPLNCTAEIPLCSYDCPGPDAYLLKQSSSKSVCYGEYFLHSFILRIFCTVVVYIFWNLSRMLLMNGIVMLYWRALTPKGFEYLGTCDRDGNVLEDSERELKETIPTVIKAFEHRARLTIVAAFAINIIYIVAVALLANAIAYPEKSHWN